MYEGYIPNASKVITFTNDTDNNNDRTKNKMSPPVRGGHNNIHHIHLTFNKTFSIKLNVQKLVTTS